jgi:acetylornithine deacetylase/succinyl-diaminopimelate desuccinylase-like protein
MIMHRAWLLGVAVLAGCGGPKPRPEAPAAALDLEREGAEAVRLLRELIRFDTVNPPPPGSSRPNAGETALLLYVKGLLAAEGIDSEIYEAQPGRGNLVARYRGTGAKPAVLLMSHVDVVNFDASRWEVEPLSGAVRDGFVWGRGALDDKDGAAVFVQVLRILARTRPRLSRDVIVMLNSDEESSGKFGARWMVEKHWDKIACEAVLSEGGRVALRDGKEVEYDFETAEKVYNDFRLWVRGRSGHSSVPVDRNAIYTLGRLLEKLERFRTPIRLTETAAASLAALADLPANAAWKDAMKKASAGDLAAAEDLCKEPRFNALLRSTFVPTIVRGGIRENVLPPDAEINFNVRLLPGDRIDDLIGALLRYLEVPKVEVVEGDAAAFEKWKQEKKDADMAVFLAERGVDAPATSLRTEMYRTLDLVARRLSPGAVVAPRLSPGATDLRFFRMKGVQAYGIGPCPAGEEENTLHDHNERVRIKSVESGVRFVLETVIEAGR